MLTTISAGLLLGLAASLHCVGMCGPLSFALPVHQLPPARKAAALGVYHFGRIFTYVILGLVFGLAGHSLYLAGMQQVLSIVLGSIMIIFTVQYFILLRSWQPAFVKKFYARLQQQMMALMNKSSWKNYLLFGSLNGLLPCGMVYIAIAAAMSSNNVFSSMLLMAGFGSATLPAMFMLGYFSYLLDLRVRKQLRKLSPYFICVVGVLLILRGLNLGIPFISPAMASEPAAAVSCH